MTNEPVFCPRDCMRLPRIGERCKQTGERVAGKIKAAEGNHPCALYCTKLLGKK